MRRKGVTKVVVIILVIFVMVGLVAMLYQRLHKETGKQSMKEVKDEKGTEEILDKDIINESNVITEEVTNQYTLNINSTNKGVDIGSMMYGLFFEDINFAADGGIYAELIKNRSFEYTEELASKGALHGYTSIGESRLEIQNTSPLNENNPNYLQITNSSNEEAGIINSGFLEGISYIEKEEYRFSVYLRSKNYKGNIKVNLLNKSKKIIGIGEISNVTDKWAKYVIVIQADSDALNGALSFVLDSKGTLDVDMVSLFPINTYKNRENGLRTDLVEMLEELEPSFIRFPGGCIVEGDPLTSAYRWKDTVGDVAERKQNSNLWIGTKEHPYYQSYGLGFYEYFLLCEDLGAEPVPVVNAGLSCQARSGNKQGVAANDEELQEYIQDALDLIEFCNGDVTTTWGSVRASMGHPEPFNLKYLGVGNENWESIYFTRYTQFVTAIREVYPEIKLITSSGPASDGGLFNFAWNTMSFQKNDEYKYADLMDEHYYNSADWFLSNTKRYDSYERNYVDVFLGEYAAKSNSLYAAIAEAAYMTGLERNADVVKMASYAPLFGNLLSRQWNPDMIYFNNNNAFGSINYYVQKMFANNVGDYTVVSELEGTKGSLSGISGKIGLGTWSTSALFDDIKIEVKPDMIKCYLNGSLVHTIEVEQTFPIYETVSIDAESGEMIIKIVNSREACDVIINIENATNLGETASLELLAGEKASLENNVLKPENVVPLTSTIEVSESFSYRAPSYSVSIIRVSAFK